MPDSAAEWSDAGKLSAFDLDLLADFDLRYRQALATCPLDAELPYADLWSEMPGEYLSESHVAFPLPDACLRPVSLRLPEWDDDVRVFEAAGTPRHQRQRHALLRASMSNPAVFVHAGVLLVYGVWPASKGSTTYADAFRAVVMPESGEYVMSATLLNEIITKMMEERVC